MNGEKKFDFEALEVYQRAVEFANVTYEKCGRFPKDAQYSLADQLRRAALSISLNIAEGSGAFHRQEKKQFYRISRRSCFECIPALTIAVRQHFIRKEEYKALYDDCYKLSKMLSGLIRSLDKLNK